MTFESSGMGAGMDNPIPKVREREGNGKNPFPKFGNGKGIKKTFPKFGNEKIHSHKSGKGIRGFHSWEWTGAGIPAHPCKESLQYNPRQKPGSTLVLLSKNPRPKNQTANQF